jgi:hypothetical protein
MNYRLIYDRVIDKYGTWEKPKDVYVERHRKVPGCRGGKYTKGNAFYVPARVHHLCHVLLVKIHPKDSDMIDAVHLMSSSGKYGSRYYSWLKREFSKRRKLEMTGQNNPMKREDIRNKVAIGLLGNKRTLGYCHTDIFCTNVSERMKGNTIARANKGKPKSEEHKDKIKESLKGKPKSEKHKTALKAGWIKRKANKLKTLYETPNS